MKAGIIQVSRPGKCLLHCIKDNVWYIRAASEPETVGKTPGSQFISNLPGEGGLPYENL